MKVLIADKMSEQGVEDLKAFGAEVQVNADLKAGDLPGVVGDVDVLIVRSTKVKTETIEAAPRLSLIVRAGAGYDTIDVATASARGIHVANCPGKNADAVAELAIGLIVAADRRLADATMDMRSGKWRKGEYGRAAGLLGRTLALIGYGTIGKGVAHRARGLGLNVLVWSRSMTAERAASEGIGFLPSPLDAAKVADIVSVHVASKPDTKHLIGEGFFKAMKPGAIFVNTSRGAVVDSAALERAIAEKGLRVGLDVYENEPAGKENDFPGTDLAAMATCTPHIGASTEQASEAIATEAVRVVKVFKQTGTPPNAVNICARSPAQYTMVVRHYDRVGVLAGILQSLKDDSVNVEEMHNTVFEGAKAACCTLLLGSKPSGKTVAAIEEAADVLQVDLVARVK